MSQADSLAHSGLCLNVSPTPTTTQRPRHKVPDQGYEGVHRGAVGPPGHRFYYRKLTSRHKD
jgi:hypothetical protein